MKGKKLQSKEYFDLIRKNPASSELNFKQLAIIELHNLFTISLSKAQKTCLLISHCISCLKILIATNSLVYSFPSSN